MFKRQHPSSSPSSEPGFVAPPTSVGSGASTSCTRWSSSSAGSLSSSKPQDRHQGAPTTPPVPFPLSGSATAITVVQPLRSTPRFPEHTTELRGEPRVHPSSSPLKYFVVDAMRRCRLSPRSKQPTRAPGSLARARRAPARFPRALARPDRAQMHRTCCFALLLLLLPRRCCSLLYSCRPRERCCPTSVFAAYCCSSSRRPLHPRSRPTPSRARALSGKLSLAPTSPFVARRCSLMPPMPVGVEPTTHCRRPSIDRAPVMA
ncbi:hypothetical protein ZWY2020_042060 [Hordeum vulgare]|nr:hypothetical protein ZWY2020_042060 [Hordeum vulgare]